MEQAEDDLQGIFSYIAHDSVRAAESYTTDIVTACDRLRDFPLSGRSFNRRYRALVVRNHLVLYRYDHRRAEVTIAAIVDGRMHIAAVLRQLKDSMQ